MGMSFSISTNLGMTERGWMIDWMGVVVELVEKSRVGRLVPGSPGLG